VEELITGSFIEVIENSGEEEEQHVVVLEKPENLRSPS